MPRRVNLLPQAERSRISADFGFIGLLAIAVIVIFLVGLGYFLLNGTLNDREEELTTLQQDVASLMSEVSALSEYETLQTRRVSAERIVQAIYASRTPVSDFLDALSLVLPEDAWFQSLSVTTVTPQSAPSGGAEGVAPPGDNRLSVEGNTYTFEGIAQLLIRLQLVPSLSDVELVAAGEAKGFTDPAKDVKGFSIEASVKNTQAADAPLPMSQVEVEGP